MRVNIILFNKMGTCANEKRESESKNVPQIAGDKSSKQETNNRGAPLTESQLHEAIDKLFDKFDTDNNGYLDSNEAVELLKTSLGQDNVSAKDINDII